MSSTYEQFKQRRLFFKHPTTHEDILSVFGDAEEWLSRAQIAGRVMRTLTPTVIRLIEELVEAGELIKAAEPLPNGYKKFWYKRGPEKLL